MLLQVKAVIDVVAMVLVKMKVLVVASLLRRGMDPLGPLDARVILEIEEHLFHGCVKRGLDLKPTWGEVDLWPDPAVSITFFHPTTFIFLQYPLLFPLSLIRLRIGPSIPFSPNIEGILNVHVLLCLHHEVSHVGRGILDRENRNLEGSNPAIRAATIIFSSTSFTCSISLLNLNI